MERRLRTPRGAGAEAPEAPEIGEGDPLFLSQVQETLRQISTGAAAGSPEAGPHRPDPDPGLQAPPRRLAALLERVRRHEEAVLALILLAGIAAMVLHWVR